MSVEEAVMDQREAPPEEWPVRREEEALSALEAAIRAASVGASAFARTPSALRAIDRFSLRVLAAQRVSRAVQ